MVVQDIRNSLEQMSPGITEKIVSIFDSEEKMDVFIQAHLDRSAAEDEMYLTQLGYIEEQPSFWTNIKNLFRRQNG